jgi:hypothetical protein
MEVSGDLEDNSWYRVHLFLLATSRLTCSLLFKTFKIFKR